jgi:predicted transport protein
MKMTERSAKWAGTVLANCEANTGRSLAQWGALAKKARVKDARTARVWAKEQGLSTVYQSAVVEALFPAEEADDDLVDAQYSGPKAALRPIYDALVHAVRAFGDDVEIMPRKSQVTFSRAKSFAVVRAATKDRVDVALKLHGEKPTNRLVLDPKAARSDPSHVVGLRAVKDVDTELVGWLRKARDRAGSKA